MPFDHLKKNAFSTSTKSYFGLFKRQKMSSKCDARNWIIALTSSSKSHFELVKLSSKCNASPWNIAFSTLRSPHFWLIKRQEMGAQCLATSWNIVFSTWINSHLDWSKVKIFVQSTMGALETLFYRLYTSSTWGWSRCRKWNFRCFDQNFCFHLQEFLKLKFKLDIRNFPWRRNQEL